MILIEGEFSHAIRKGPMLGPALDEVDGLYREETIEGHTASSVSSSWPTLPLKLQAGSSSSMSLCSTRASTWSPPRTAGRW